MYILYRREFTKGALALALALALLLCMHSICILYSLLGPAPGMYVYMYSTRGRTAPIGQAVWQSGKAGRAGKAGKAGSRVRVSRVE